MAPSFGPNGPPQYQTSFYPENDFGNNMDPHFTIVDIYPMVMADKPEQLDEAVQGLKDFASQMTKTATALDGNYSKVRSTWKSDAGDIFSAYLDDTVWSLQDWHDATTDTAAALTKLAGAIRKSQTDMTNMWNDFSSKIADAEAKQKKGHSLWDGWGQFTDGWSLGWHHYKTDLDPVLEDYTNRVKTEILGPLDTAYSDAYLAIRPGSKFQGPTNGPSRDQVTDAMRRLMTPPGGRPGGPGPAPAGLRGPAPTPPPGTPPPALPPELPPALPPGVTPAILPGDWPQGGLPPAPPTSLPQVMPVALPAPTPPQAPSMPVLPPGTMPTLPPAPVSFAAPEAPPALGIMGTAPQAPGALGPAPQMPGNGLQDGLPPSAPGQQAEEPSMGRPGAPGMPGGLQGRGGSSMPEMPGSGMRTPPPPQLSGRGGNGTKRPSRPGMPRGEEPEMPPPGRGGPALPGRNGRGRGRVDENGRPVRPGGPGDDIPPNPARLGSPRNLQGTRDTKLRWRPGSAESEELPLRTLPTLNGRLGPQSEAMDESIEAAERALRPGLDGRGMSRRQQEEPEAAATRARAARKRTESVGARTEVPAVDFVGDSELFTPEQAAPAVIDRPEDAKPIVSEKAALRPAPEDRRLA